MVEQSAPLVVWTQWMHLIQCADAEAALNGLS